MKKILETSKKIHKPIHNLSIIHQFCGRYCSHTKQLINRTPFITFCGRYCSHTKQSINYTRFIIFVEGIAHILSNP